MALAAGKKQRQAKELSTYRMDINVEMGHKKATDNDSATIPDRREKKNTKERYTHNHTHRHTNTDTKPTQTIPEKREKKNKGKYKHKHKHLHKHIHKSTNYTINRAE